MKTNSYLKEIKSKVELRKFVDFPNNLYDNEYYYIPQLRKKEIKTLSPETNPAFEFCEVKYWLAIKNERVVGRIAGIINRRNNKIHHQKFARFGWLDFIDDYDMLSMMLHEVENWARKEGMDYIHGPLGFNSFDPSGVLVKGFNEIPTSFGRYNFRYYSKFLEKAGYKKDIDWVEYNINVPKKMPESIVKASELIRKRYELISITPKNQKELLGYSDELFTLLNSTYKNIYAFTELTEKQKEDLKNNFIPLLLPEFVSLVTDKTEKLIGFGIAMPSYSKALQKAKGKLYPWGIFRCNFAKYNNDTAEMLLIGIDKCYQNKGVNSLIFCDIVPNLIKRGITNIETSRELENNRNVNNLWKKYEARQHKSSRCYIKKLKNE